MIVRQGGTRHRSEYGLSTEELVQSGRHARIGSLPRSGSVVRISHASSHIPCSASRVSVEAEQLGDTYGSEAQEAGRQAARTFLYWRCSLRSTHACELLQYLTVQDSLTVYSGRLPSVGHFLRRSFLDGASAEVDSFEAVGRPQRLDSDWLVFVIVPNQK